ncbi:uncharacterized protein LOC110726194 [Chenopodium quinoa]|uniref:uncharacterized protein LOC110726194 n=1 Tax=Chenopodium quinoa TaxID=63459 RepID=UPI000B7820C3|nr:uncharacterized protein LOC110726194 [Chenopodium quinoa]XP_021761352.1 uncharacterized protein LOC110726194 [Chenopodium quinoa]
MLYQVRIWLDEKEITVVDPWVLIENDGSISDVDEREYVPNECLWKTPSFECTFTKGYINKPKINIPLHFARAHVQGLKDPTDVRLYVSRWWPATMRIQFDINNKILTCTVRKGVSEMIAGEGVELGEKALVELEDMEPPTLGITFT